jgi:hypothetical protein
MPEYSSIQNMINGEFAGDDSRNVISMFDHLKGIKGLRASYVNKGTKLNPIYKDDSFKIEIIEK